LIPNSEQYLIFIFLNDYYIDDNLYEKKEESIVGASVSFNMLIPNSEQYLIFIFLNDYYIVFVQICMKQGRNCTC